VNKQGWNLSGDGKPIRTGSSTDFKGKPEFGRKIKMSKGKMSKRKMPNATKTENKMSNGKNVER